jgi:hypothetical protein
LETGEKGHIFKTQTFCKKISLRLPEAMLEELKLLANKRDVPYQSLLKIFLAERIEKELNAHFFWQSSSADVTFSNLSLQINGKSNINWGRFIVNSRR